MKKKMSPSSLLFISCILVLSTLPRSTGSASLIHHVCYDEPKNIDPELCTRLLQSIPSAVSATWEFNLSIAILEAGILNSTSTHEHIFTLKGDNNDNDAALEECQVSYSYAAGALSSALAEVKDQSSISVTTSDELTTRVSQYMKKCQDILVEKKIKDEIIFIGNRVVPILAGAAYSAIVRLWNPLPPPLS